MLVWCAPAEKRRLRFRQGVIVGRKVDANTHSSSSSASLFLGSFDGPTTYAYVFRNVFVNVRRDASLRMIVHTSICTYIHVGWAHKQIHASFARCCGSPPSIHFYFAPIASWNFCVCVCVNYNRMFFRDAFYANAQRRRRRLGFER